MSPSKLNSLSATALAAKSALLRFRNAASEVWPDLPPLRTDLSIGLTNVALWAEKGGKGTPNLAGLGGLFFEPVVQAPPPPPPPPVAEASVAEVMGKLGAKGGASKSERKLAAARATLAKINAAKAAARAKRET